MNLDIDFDTELSPCPLCGAQASFLEDRISCDCCLCDLRKARNETSEQLVSNWNRRATTPPAPTPAAAEGQAERDWPLNEELEELWNEHHFGHPADFAADVLERWGGCPAGLLGHGGALSKKPAAPLPRQAAVQNEDAARLDWLEQRGNDGGLLLHAGNQDTGGRSGLGLINTGRTLRQAVDSARGVKSAKSATATTEKDA